MRWPLGNGCTTYLRDVTDTVQTLQYTDTQSTREQTKVGFRVPERNQEVINSPERVPERNQEVEIWRNGNQNRNQEHNQ